MVHERSLMKEDCGVFGVVLDNPEASVYIYYGLQALQHRGEESAGIAVYDGSEAHVQKGMGLVSEVFDRTKIKSLKAVWVLGMCVIPPRERPVCLMLNHWWLICVVTPLRWLIMGTS